MIDMICIRCDCYDGHDKCLVDLIQAGFEHNQNSKDRRTKISGLKFWGILEIATIRKQTHDSDEQTCRRIWETGWLIWDVFLVDGSSFFLICVRLFWDLRYLWEMAFQKPTFLLFFILQLFQSKVVFYFANFGDSLPSWGKFVVPSLVRFFFR